MTGNKRKITDLKVVELRVELEKRGLDTKGLKGVLVQRLQKAIEDDGGYGSEIEISGPETSSPKPSGRRVIGRTKRTQNDENTESSQDEEKSEMYACVETSEKPRDDVNEGDREQEESLAEQIIEEPADVFEKTPQSYSQDDFSHQDEEEGEVYQDAEESVDSKENMLIGCDELALEEAEGKSYDYRTHEEDSMDVPLEEDGGIPEDVVPDDWSKEMHSVENPEELEGSEEIVVEEVETAVVEKWDEAQVTIQADNFQVILEPIKLETKLPSQEKKKDSEMVVAGNEDDVLDMLDYDLEITGEQNNLNVNSEDVSKKAEKTTGEAKTTDKKTMEAKREVSDPPPEKKSRSTVDSQQKKSNPESKSAKSNSSKDGRKESTKKDTSPNRNLWISGLSSTTRASELKSAFSRYGKVIGAKVVTNVKSPGSRCYGYITMTSVEAAKKCILHLNNTDMHGRMITVEVAKGDPSASSKRQSSGSTSTSFTKKETDSKDHGKKETSDSKTNSTTRKSSSSTQPSTKADKGNSDNQGKVDSGKKTESEQGGPAAEHRKSDDKDKTGKPKPKSPNRERQRDTTNSTSQRSGDKRHQNRSPGNSGSGARQRYNKDEPERKRMRQPNDDRKVVLDSHKGELRVNVSSVDGSRQGGRDERSAMGNVSRNIISRRRSFSPIRRRPETSPIRGQAPSRAGIRNARGGPFRNRTARGRGLISRHTAPGGRQAGFATSRAQRGRVQRERVRARLPLRLRERGGLVQPTHMERDRLRREREEREKLRLQREGLERERRQLEKDRQERERLEQERIRLEQERKRELEHIEREKAEMRRLQEITRYEVEQRQRAIKRTYDDDGPIGHRGSRSSNRDAYESKRSMMGSAGVRDMRDGRRAEREERRSYGGYNSREGRNGGRAAASPPPVSYRSSQNSFRNSGGGPGKITSRQIESRRQIPSDSHDTDARYVGVGPGPTALVRRSDDKYDRREQGRTIEYGHSSYDRESAADRHIESPVRRRGGQQRASALNHRDGRKVITRERTDQRGTSPDFRRASRGNISRIEITRVEQSPPLRRQRRGSSPPPTSVRVSSWREPKVASSRRDDDRDLREQLRGRQTSNMTGSYGDSSRDRERGSQRRAAVSAVSVSPVRSGVQYQSRWPSDSGDSGQIYSVNNSSNPIPTQTGRTGSTASWHSLSSSWQQGAATNGRTSWPGSAMPSATSVGRPIMPSTHTLVPSATTMVPVPPGTTIIPTSANQAYLPTADRQSRSFQPSYKTITRRY